MTTVQTYVISATTEGAIKIMNALDHLNGGVIWYNGRVVASALHREDIVERVPVSDAVFWSTPLPRHVINNLPRMTQRLVEASDNPLVPPSDPREGMAACALLRGRLR